MEYLKIPKISPSIYKPPRIVKQKTLRSIAPRNLSPPGGLYLEFAVEYKGKQSKNGKHKPPPPQNKPLKKIYIYIQSTPDNSNLQWKSKKVRVIGSSSYREFEENSREYGKKQFLLHSEHFNHI